jgi:CheY-like chemotaxis protein
VDAEQVLHASARAAGLTRQLLAYSRRQRLDAQVIDLNEVVQLMSDLLRRLIGENIAFETRLPPAPLHVLVDRGQIEQVLLNLVVNARDAMPGGGTLSITTSAMELGATHAAAEPDTVPGRYACLTVEDTGQGMAEDVRRRAFDPFFTTKGPGKGTGLGLSTVYGIVHQSGGLVWIESVPDEGTRVSVSLPLAAGQPAPPAPAATAPPQSPGGRTVLVVEDEPSVRGLVCRTLQAAGYRVLVAEDGERGLAVSRATESPIDLLVTDVIMPRMGGRELASRLAEERPGLPVLFISGYSNDGEEGLDVTHPGADFLQKPFAPSALLLRVRQGLAAAPHAAGTPPA